MASSRPNFLIIMADQLTPGVLPAYGGRVARTPHLDALAAAGIVFESAYCNSPLCAPSRFSFMTGQLPARIGAFDNAAELAAELPTFAHYLRDAGYETVLSGKMHFCGPDQLHGFEERLTTDIYPADFGWTPDWLDFGTRPRWYHTMDSVTQAGPCVRTNQIDFDDSVVFEARRKLFDIARSRDRRPFCLVASMTHPHDPYVTPAAYWERYRDEDVELPRVPAGAVPADPHSARIRHVVGLELATPTTAEVHRARRAYLGSVSYVDDQVGLLLQTLADARLAEDTVIVFLADHGDMLGERGLWYKMNFFEPAARVPLIISAPGRFTPGRHAGLASLVDLLPTLVELAGGAPLAAPADGTSLVPALAGSAAPGEVFGEYCGEAALAPLVMIRRGPFKYVHSPVDPDQLYDLAHDPLELANLAVQPGAAATLAAFRAETAARWDLPGLHAAVLASQRRRHLVYRALRKGRFRPWDHQPPADAAKLYIRNDQELNDLEAMARFPRV
jgi:choline-sulfatase